MKEIPLLQLDETDMAIADGMRAQGIPIYIARAMVYLSGAGAATSREIERGANVRQPEVSRAMKYLIRKGWVEQNGHEYGLSQSIQDIVGSLEAKARAKMDAQADALNRLKQLAEA